MQPGMIFVKKGILEVKGHLTYLKFDFSENNIDPQLIQVGCAIQHNDRMSIIDEIIPSGVPYQFNVRIHYM